MGIIEIFRRIELTSNLINEEVFKQLVNKILFSDKYDIDLSCSLSIRTKYRLVNRYMRQTSLQTLTELRNLLSKYEYNFRQEIKNAENEIAFMGRDLLSEDITSLQSRYFGIDDINYNNGEFIIHSTDFKDFRFNTIRSYFKDCPRLLEYIDNNELARRCHKVTYDLVKMMPDLCAITSLCPREFKGGYYHSYAYDRTTDNIIDLARKIVMAKDSYYELFLPEEISIVTGEEVDNIIKSSDSLLALKEDYFELMLVALYKQSLIIQKENIVDPIHLVKKIKMC